MVKFAVCPAIGIVYYLIKFKPMKKNLFGLMVAFFAFSTLSIAQIRTPAPSPGLKWTQAVGLSEVSLEYSRPSAKGRTIFAADGLVPYGDLWRTGANTATKISFSDKVWVEGKELAAGSYAILTRPNAGSWDVNFYKHESTSFNSYTDKTPDATVTVSTMALPMQIETFTIGIGDLTNDGATLQFIWANTYAPVRLKFDVDGRVMANIEQVMAGPSGNDYFAAASYMHDAGKDLNVALGYIEKATSGANPAFWMVRRKALILADLGRKKEAIAAAKQSLELAKAANNNDYVRMNEASIKEWSM